MSEKTVAQELAERSDLVKTVSSVAGVIFGGCSSALAIDIIENVSPQPVSVGKKVIYGIGGYCFGNIAYKAVADDVEKTFMDLGGTVLQVKAGIEGLLNGNNND